MNYPVKVLPMSLHLLLPMSMPFTFRTRPYNTIVNGIPLNDMDDSMDMIGHNDKFTQFQPVNMMDQIAPCELHNLPVIIQRHFPGRDVSKPTLMLIRANCDEIRTR
jgi:hypothetical protein